METSFSYEEDLVKHYVRYKAWLPACRERKKRALTGLTPNQSRRLKYFTFCASGAVDVLMLDVAKIVSPGSSGRFDNVVFFERNADFIADIQRRVPGSIGFPGEFTDVVLIDDPHEEELAEGLDTLAPPENMDDTARNRELMRQLSQRRGFIAQFPFDIINLDLQDFFFRERDPLPGHLVNCMRKLFTWQQRPLSPDTPKAKLSGFTLMFTTQIGPPNMTPEYKQMLVDCILSNVARFPELEAVLSARLGGMPWQECPDRDFLTFFKIAAPKIIASVLHENDWYVAGSDGVTIYEFERPSSSGPYRMLHLIIDVKRKNPHVNRRAPGADDAEGLLGYREAVKSIIQKNTQFVDDAMVLESQEELSKNLAFIKARRRKYETQE